VRDLLLLGTREAKHRFITNLREQSCNTSDTLECIGIDFYKIKINNEIIRIWTTNVTDKFTRLPKTNIAIILSPELMAGKFSAPKDMVVVNTRPGEMELQCVFRAVEIKPDIPREKQLIRLRKKVTFFGILSDMLTSKTPNQRAAVVHDIVKNVINP
jgi:hypothetical protein